MAHLRFACFVPCILLVGLVGCRSSARPPAPPEMVPERRVWVGTPVSGPLEGKLSVSTSAAISLRVRWIALQQLPADALAPIDVKSRLIITPGSATALPVAARLTREVRFGSGDAANSFIEQLSAGRLGSIADVAAQSHLIIPGATVQFSLHPVETGGSAPRISVLVSPDSSRGPTTRPVEVTVGVRIDGPEPSGSGVAARETAVVDAVRLTDGLAFVVAVPFNRPGKPWTVIAAIATVETSPLDAAATEKLQADLMQASGEAQAGRSRSPLGNSPTLGSALAALNDPWSVRPAMLLLTSLSDARIAGDMALVADNNQLAALVAETQRLVKSDAVPPLPDLQWILDRCAVQLMCEAAVKNALSPELKSVLALHAGDVARRPDELAELLKQVGNSNALADRLVAENLIALEDNSPAARMRAYDWLTTRNKAPAGFDPYADAKSRRAALDKAMTKPGGQP